MIAADHGSRSEAQVVFELRCATSVATAAPAAAAVGEDDDELEEKVSEGGTEKGDGNDKEDAR